MKITITPTAQGTSATPFLIADDTPGLVSTQAYPAGVGGLVLDNGFVPRLKVATQRDELIGAAYAQELPRGNWQTEWVITVNRQATSLDAMFMFLRDHFSLLPTVGLVTCTINNTNGYLRNAVVKDPQCTKQKGLDFSVQYTFVGSFIANITGGAGSGSGGPWQPS